MLVFDLDGTISDPKIGWCQSINFALAQLGYPVRDIEELPQYFEASLEATLSNVIGGAEPSDMIIKFREYYGVSGYKEDKLYPGVIETIYSLHNDGIPLGVCTGKPTIFAEKILALFGLRGLFSFVSGGDIGVSKADQLRDLLKHGEIDHNAIMVGDRDIDLKSAHANGLASCGVLWGYGSREELLAENPRYLIESPKELLQIAKV